VDGDISTFSGLANAWVDYRVGRFTPYIGGGIGLANVSANEISIAGTDVVDDSDTVFAYQVGTGVAYSLTQNFSLTLDYRYFATSDPKLTDEAGGDLEAEVSNHSILAGVRYGF
jgi:outer membrane autotransporter protein